MKSGTRGTHAKKSYGCQAALAPFLARSLDINIIPLHMCSYMLQIWLGKQSVEIEHNFALWHTLKNISLKNTNEVCYKNKMQGLIKILDFSARKGDL